MIVGRVIAEDRGGRVLLMRRAMTDRFPGCWELPGGKVDRGEQVSAAVARELMEETGLALVGALRQVSSRPLITPGRKEATEIIFRAKVSGHVRLSDEHCDYQFHTLGSPLPEQRTDSLLCLL